LASGKDVSKMKFPIVYIGGEKHYKCPFCEFYTGTKIDMIWHIRSGLHNFKKREPSEIKKPKKRKRNAKIYQF